MGASAPTHKTRTGQDRPTTGTDERRHAEQRTPTRREGRQREATSGPEADQANKKEEATTATTMKRQRRSKTREIWRHTHRP